MSLSSSLKSLLPGGRHKVVGSKIKKRPSQQNRIYDPNRPYAEKREPRIHIPAGLHKRFIIFYNKDVWPLVLDSMPQQ